MLKIRHYRLYGVDLGLVRNPDVTAQDTRAMHRLVLTKGVVTVIKITGKALRFTECQWTISLREAQVKWRLNGGG